MGIVRGDGIVAVAADVVGAATALLDRIVTDDRELVTVLTGADAARRRHGGHRGVAGRSSARTSRSRCTTAGSRCTRTSSASNRP